MVAAAVAWSTAPFFTRLLPLDSWTILFWRGVFGGAMITAIMLLIARPQRLARSAGYGQELGWLVASLSTLAHDGVHPVAAADQRLERCASSSQPVRWSTAAIAWMWLREAIALRSRPGDAVRALRRRDHRWRRRGVDSDMLGIALACFMTVVHRRHDGRGAAPQEHADGGRRGLVQHPGQHRQLAVCPGHRRP